MSGGFPDENDPQYRFTGVKYYLNSYTKRGRFNWVALTYGTLFGFFLLNKMFKKKEVTAK